MTSSRSDAHVATPVRFVSRGFLASMVRPLVAYVIAPRCAHIDGVPTMCCLAMSDVVWGSSDVASPAFYIVCCLSALHRSHHLPSGNPALRRPEYRAGRRPAATWTERVWPEVQEAVIYRTAARHAQGPHGIRVWARRRQISAGSRVVDVARSAERTCDRAGAGGARARMVRIERSR